MPERQITTSAIEVPNVLKDFGDVPNGLVTVHHNCKRMTLPSIANGGLLIAKNNLIYYPYANLRVHDALQEAAQELEINIDRSKVIFAYPSRISTLDTKRTIIEAKIDPDLARVADERIYNLMAWNEAFGNPKQNRDLARKYWEHSSPLSEYLEDPYPLVDPEVLIPTDVPPPQIKISEK